MKLSDKIPEHVAIIMDGNGRWAQRRGLPKMAGHREGVKAARAIVKAASELGIKYLTLYTFSTENWKRPKAEVSMLFRLLEDYLDKESQKLNEKNIRFMVIGAPEGLPETLRKKLDKTIASTSGNTGLTLSLALNYGARQEILEAVRRISKETLSGSLDPGSIDDFIFSDHLYTKGMPDPDLLIRTSGEERISNFLLWQIAYSELYFTKKFWPDFTAKDLKKAVRDYGKRERRFGA